MRKTLMFVASALMAVALIGCGYSKEEPDNVNKVAPTGNAGSVKAVAETFVNAVIRRELDKAANLTVEAAVGVDSHAMKELRERIDALGKGIGDDTLETREYSEEIEVPSPLLGYKIVNGAKITEDEATVVVQFVKGKKAKPQGMKVELGRVDGKWRVRDFQYVPDGLDASGM